MALFDWLFGKKGTNLPDTVEHAKNSTGRYDDYSDYDSRYEYVLFAPYIDVSKIIGKTTPYFTAESSAQAQYIYKLNRLSKTITDRHTLLTKDFFDLIDELEDNLYNCPFVSIKNFDLKAEIEYYKSQKEQIIIDFINRSFKNCYETALRLKTVKGRVSRIDNWFLQMEYFKRYMTEKEKYIIDQLYYSWLEEAGGLVEKGE